MRYENVKGTRDFNPEEMEKRKYIIDVIRKTFEEFGFVEIDTPCLEKWDVLSKKGAGGEGILEETYKFEDKSKALIGLRYDLTVPLARFVAMNKKLPLPFKRYQIGKVWRYGDISKGRLREFLQADIDIVGADSILADAEVLACASSALKKLKIDFLIRINSRKILNSIMKKAGIKNELVIDALRSIDKLDKISEDEVKKELFSKGFGKEVVEKIFEMIKSKPEELKIDGIEELNKLSDYLKLYGINNFKIDFSLARGLDYYTGPIFEIVSKERIGSIAGGGRYDNLIELFSSEKIPATGISLGIERIFEILKEYPKKKRIFVALSTEDVFEDAIKIVKMLREKFYVDYDLKGRKLSKQMEYANAAGFSIVVIVGKKDLENNEVTVRDMESGNEKKIKIKDLESFLENFKFKEH
jgi:histidyl-tRNA synthetase